MTVTTSPEPWDGRLTLWRIDLDAVSERDDQRIRRELAPDELERAARLRSPLGSRRWMRARGALREILARASGAAAGEIELVLSEAGKPALAGESRVRFNLAHSAGLALVVLAHDHDVGVDVERVREGLHESGIARRMLGEDAVAQIAGMPAAQRTGAFFRLWVRHEAAVKCRGVGLADAVGRDVRTGLVIEDVSAEAGYAAAWALDGPRVAGPVEATTFDWSGLAQGGLAG